MFKVLKSLFYISLFLFCAISQASAAESTIAAPQILKLTSGEILSLNGQAPSNTEVLIYLDGIFIGRTGVIDIDNEQPAGARPVSASWQFQHKPEQKLLDGTHALMAVAQDKNSLVLSSPSDEIKFSVNAIPSPTIISPAADSPVSRDNLQIVGLTKSGTAVKIFIDENLVGQTSIRQHDSGTASFVYKPVLDFNFGWHKITVQAEDAIGHISQPSTVLNIKIELPYPAPTMLQPVVNAETVASQPFIVGLAKNDSLVKIYLDKKYSGEFKVKNHQSGTANFAFKAPVLSRGNHAVYALAFDSRGKSSIVSKTINFSVKSAAIAQSAAEASETSVKEIQAIIEKSGDAVDSLAISDIAGMPENNIIEQAEQGVEAVNQAEEMEEPLAISQDNMEDQAMADTSDIKSGNDLTLPAKNDRQDQAGQDENALEKIKGLISQSVEKKPGDRGGLINEGRQNQSKLKLSLVLFILFLVGVVAWLLWVNRELVKERRAQNEAEEKKENEARAGQDNKLL